MDRESRFVFFTERERFLLNSKGGGASSPSITSLRLRARDPNTVLSSHIFTWWLCAHKFNNLNHLSDFLKTYYTIKHVNGIILASHTSFDAQLTYKYIQFPFVSSRAWHTRHVYLYFIRCTQQIQLNVDWWIPRLAINKALQNKRLTKRNTLKKNRLEKGLLASIANWLWCSTFTIAMLCSPVLLWEHIHAGNKKRCSVSWCLNQLPQQK
jgi:hypothetical protein